MYQFMGLLGSNIEKLIFKSFSVFKVFITKVIIVSLEPVIVSRVVIRNISM